MSYRRSPVARILPWIISLGITVAALFFWADDILAYVTGQDIMQDLDTDIRALLPTATPITFPGAASETPSPAPDSVEEVVVDTGEIAPDGFPVVPRPYVIRYTVQPGDSLFQIAERFNLDPDTIFWANSETLKDNVHLLFVGVQLYILPVDGVYHLSDGVKTVSEIAAQYGVAPGDILYAPFNTISDYTGDDVLPPGLRIVVPGGKRDFVSWQAPIRTGTESGGANPEGAAHPGSCRARYTGTGGAGAYINPVGSIPYRVTNGYSGYHPGVDLAGEHLSPIYASETGVVVFAGWHRDGYGELIIIDHGEGWTTYYGHLAARFVGCGDQVSKGQYIGQMGMSGNASGIHVHFEIRENDVPHNPYLFFPIRDERSNFEG